MGKIQPGPCDYPFWWVQASQERTRRPGVLPTLSPASTRVRENRIRFRSGWATFPISSPTIYGAKRSVARPRRNWAAQFAADKDFIWEVKKDWYGLDFIYVRDHPESLFWCVFLTAQPETGGLDFLPLEAVRQRVEYIQQYYQRTDADVQKAYNHPYIYLSGAEMDRFVEESTGQLFRIFRHLWINGTAADEAESALDLNI